MCTKQKNKNKVPMKGHVKWVRIGYSEIIPKALSYWISTLILSNFDIKAKNKSGQATEELEIKAVTFTNFPVYIGKFKSGMAWF